MDNPTKMDAYRRLLSYLRPQWVRVVMVVMWSMVIAAMFSLSFMTILPLLKVMMNEEGLHGWADRLAVQWRYGVEIPVTDNSQTNGRRGAVRLADVDEKGLAYQAGLRQFDLIGSLQMDSEQVHSQADILQQLAQIITEPAKATRTISVFTEGMPERSLELAVITPPLAEEQSLQWRFKSAAGERLLNLLGFLPRGADKMKQIVFIIILMSFVTILRCLGRFYQEYLAEKVVQTALASIRESIFQHAMHMPMGFFSRQGTSDTTSRLMNDVGQCGWGISIILGKALREPLKALGTLAAAMLISWKLTLIFIAAAPFTIGAFGILGKKIKKATRRSLESTALMFGRIQGAMSALSVVKVYNRQSHEIEKYHEANRTLLKRVMHATMINTMTGPLLEILGMIAGSAALIAGAVWVSNGRLEGSEFLTILVMLGTSAESIRKVSNVWNSVQMSNAAAERVFSVMDEPVEKEAADAIELSPLREKIEFRDLVFTYPGAKFAAINHLNLTVAAGRTVAIVGPNGSGKSTLVNFLPRFYDPDNGQILIDGQDIHQATLHSLRDQIGLVTQQVITFNDTIFNNIAYGKPGATMDEVIRAAQQAYAHEFIEPLADGYHTFIGENSAGFSGGQLQRIVIARAILKNPQILIFDEAMSQVDADSEMKIHKSLSELMRGRTCFLIAHRFSTVISADTIVVVDQGRVIAQGTHQELVQSCDTYKRLYETQLLTT